MWTVFMGSKLPSALYPTRRALYTAKDVLGTMPTVTRMSPLSQIVSKMDARPGVEKQTMNRLNSGWHGGHLLIRSVHTIPNIRPEDTVSDPDLVPVPPTYAKLPKKALDETKYKEANLYKETAKLLEELDDREKKALNIIVPGGISNGALGVVEDSIQGIFGPHYDYVLAINLMNAALQGKADYSQLSLRNGPVSAGGEGSFSWSRMETLSRPMTDQSASSRFGKTYQKQVTVHAEEVKINQGAKPGLGGKVPGVKVTAEIARIRGSEVGKDLESLENAPDLFSVENYILFVHRLLSSNPELKITFKIGAQPGIGPIVIALAKALSPLAPGKAEIKIVPTGGTGSAPLLNKLEFIGDFPSALREAKEALILNGYAHIQLVVAGVRTPEDIIKALFLGADAVEMGTGVLIGGLNCVMARKCHVGIGKDVCPAGLATNDVETIIELYKGDPINIVKMWIEYAKEITRVLDLYGVNVKTAVGRTDFLKVNPDAPITGLDKLIEPYPKSPFVVSNTAQDTGSSSEERELIEQLLVQPTQFFDLGNGGSHIRSFGARLAHYVVKDPVIGDLVRQHGVIVRARLFGENAGVLGPEGLTIIAQSLNDGAGSSTMSTILALKAGNHMGYGAAYGYQLVGIAGDRFGTCYSGGLLDRKENQGVIAAERIGQHGFQFMRSGLGILWGDSHSFDGFKLPKTDNPFNQPLFGPNLGTGVCGGTLIMPKKAYENGIKTRNIEADFQKRPTHPLGDVEKTCFVKALRLYSKYIGTPFSIALNTKVTSNPEEVFSNYLKITSD